MHPRSAKAWRKAAKLPPAVQASLAASPASGPHWANMYSTHAQRADVGRTVARPLRPARSRESRDSTVLMPANGAPSNGVWRLATKGATPKATGRMADSSRVKRTSSSTSASLLQRQPHHAVHLEPLEAGVGRIAGGPENLLLGVFPVDEVPHSLARAVRGDGEGTGTAAPQRVHQLLGQPVGAQRGDADPPAGVHQRPEELAHPGMVGDGCPHQPHPLGRFRDEAQHLLRRDGAHPTVGGAAHDAVVAAPAAAALGLDEKHALELGMRREDLRARRKPAVVGPSNVEGVPAAAGYPKARDSREVGQEWVTLGEGLEGLKQRVHQLLRFALDENVDEGFQRCGVGKGEWPSRHHQGVTVVRSSDSNGSPARDSMLRSPGSSSS